MNRLMRFLLPLIFVAAGIFVVVMGVRGLNEVKTFVPITVTVDEVEVIPSGDPDSSDTRTTYVVYTYEGKDYRSILQVDSGTHVRGDELTVLCDPDNPSYVSGATTTSSVIMIVGGAVFALIGLGVLVSTVLKGRYA